MPYVIDRKSAFYTKDIIALMNVRMRQVRSRSRLVMNDNSLSYTLTTPKTFMRMAAHAFAIAREKPGLMARLWH